MAGQEQAQKRNSGVAIGPQRIAEMAQCRQNCIVKVSLQLNGAPVCALIARIAVL
jgi:hypothetical protein